MQIDQDPGDYRVQAADGTWQTRVNPKLCRWLSAIGMLFLAYTAWRLGQDGGSPIFVVASAVMGFACGALFMLSIRPTAG